MKHFKGTKNLSAKPYTDHELTLENNLLDKPSLYAWIPLNNLTILGSWSIG